jgi:PEGA domain
VLVRGAAEEQNVPHLRGQFGIVENRIRWLRDWRGGFDFVNNHRMGILQASLLLLAVIANAASKSAMKIKILDSATHTVSLGGNGVPNDCDQVTFDAYCRSSKSAVVTNTLLVQEDNEPPFHIACSVESKFSRCVPLAVGESFDAKRDRHGITVYYDDNGKMRKQLYTLVAEEAKAGLPSSEKVAAQSAPAPPVQNASSSASSASANAAAVSAVAVPAPSGLAPSGEQIACNFTSTPSGAEITVDGKYVGNTPSEVGLHTGTHVVVLSLAGFIEWKRDLEVTAKSQLTISATLQKVQ